MHLWWVVVVSGSGQLAAAYARLVEAGQKVTVRGLKAEAQVSTDAAAEWLRDLEPAAGLPPAPDLSKAVGIVWAAAWQAAQRDTATAAEDLLGQARDGETVALHRAEQAEQQASTAVRDAEAAGRARESAETKAAELAAVVAGLRAELGAALEQARASEVRAIRAEAEADSVRTVLSDLRTDLRTAITPTSSARTSGAASVGSAPATGVGA